jgi:hypothetical protein
MYGHATYLCTKRPADFQQRPIIYAGGTQKQIYTFNCVTQGLLVSINHQCHHTLNCSTQPLFHSGIHKNQEINSDARSISTRSEFIELCLEASKH